MSCSVYIYIYIIGENMIQNVLKYGTAFGGLGAALF